MAVVAQKLCPIQKKKRKVNRRVSARSVQRNEKNTKTFVIIYEEINWHLELAESLRIVYYVY